MARGSLAVKALAGGLGAAGAPTTNPWAAIGGAVPIDDADKKFEYGKIYPVSSPSALADLEMRGRLPQLVRQALALSTPTVYVVPVKPIALAGTDRQVWVVSSAQEDVVKADGSTVAGADKIKVDRTKVTEEHQIKVTVTKIGAVGTGRVSVSVDGLPVLVDKATAAALSLGAGTGMSLVFGEITGKAGDEYEFWVAPKGPTNSKVVGAASATQALVDSEHDWGWIAYADPMSVATMATVSTAFASMENVGRYGFAIVRPRVPYAWKDDDGTTLNNAATPTKRSSATAYYARLTNQTAALRVYPDAEYERVSIVGAWERLALPDGGARPCSVIGPYCGALGLAGPLDPIDEIGGVVGAVDMFLGGAPTFTGAQVDALDDIGYVTVTPYPTVRGRFITHGRMFVAEDGPKGDFAYVEDRRVMDAACAAVWRAQLPRLNARQLVATDGSLAGAKSLRSRSRRVLADMVTAGQISSFNLVIAADNILARRLIETTIEVVPTGKSTRLRATISYNNPLLREPEGAAGA